MQVEPDEFKHMMVQLRRVNFWSLPYHMTIALFLSELIIYHIKNALFSTLNEDYFGKQNKKGGPCIVYCFSYYGSSFFAC